MTPQQFKRSLIVMAGTVGVIFVPWVVEHLLCVERRLGLPPHGVLNDWNVGLLTIVVLGAPISLVYVVLKMVCDYIKHG